MSIPIESLLVQIANKMGFKKKSTIKHPAFGDI
jgi:hypothetical protein